MFRRVCILYLYLFQIVGKTKAGTLKGKEAFCVCVCVSTLHVKAFQKDVLVIESHDTLPNGSIEKLNTPTRPFDNNMKVSGAVHLNGITEVIKPSHTPARTH